jgi:hypothetical protein
MMKAIHPVPACFAIAALILGCSNDATVPVGTPGAGVTVSITGTKHDSNGYLVEFNVTNHDTADVGVGGCPSVVEARHGDTWTSSTPGGQCDLILLMLPPGGSIGLVAPAQGLVAGDQIRLAFGWSFLSRNASIVTRSAQVVVGN